MRAPWCAGAVLTAALALAAAAPARAASPVVHHDLNVALHPAAHTLDADDTLTVPPGAGPRLRVVLHRGLAPRAGGTGLKDVTTAADGLPPDVRVYELDLPAGARRVTVHYAGEIYQPLTQLPTEERQMRTTSGIISSDGVYLDSGSGWYPYIDGARDTFRLRVHLPDGWDAVSQGGPVAGVAAGTVEWRCDKPQDDIFLVAAPFTRYRREAAGVMLLAYLRTPDPALADGYLRAAGQYIARYAKLLGPYPYAKFAVVENFWQSGYGMPSFTLLGSEILRFPFIIYTSYPHEILHDWWGNGVFVDYGSGNWSEGLTAYLSDYMGRAQRGKGSEYRRDTLQKYADFVAAGRDFPLSEFSARNSQASEAVGYGKGMMLFHMLRRRLGDAAFVSVLRRFYHDYVFRYAGFDDIRREVERVAGGDWRPFFRQWVDRTGAPILTVGGAHAVAAAKGHAVSLTLVQDQAGPAYTLDVPVAITLQGRARAYVTDVHVKDRRTTVTLPVPAAPRRVDVDPQFDVFRRLAPAEVPPALSGLFGADSLLIVLPAAAPAPLAKAYRELADAWRSSPAFSVTVTTDDRLRRLPDKGAVWLFGWKNRFRDQAVEALRAYPDVTAKGTGTVGIAGRHLPAAGATLVAAVHRQGSEQVLGWLATAQPAAVPGLARKLPHYSKYGYLIFQGAAPDNVARGTWPVLDSPMTVMLTGGAVPMGALPRRRPLLQLIPEDLGDAR